MSEIIILNTTCIDCFSKLRYVWFCFNSCLQGRTILCCVIHEFHVNLFCLFFQRKCCQVKMFTPRIRNYSLDFPEICSVSTFQKPSMFSLAIHPLGINPFDLMMWRHFLHLHNKTNILAAWGQNNEQ